jgi:hypothetical protein
MWRTLFLLLSLFFTASAARADELSPMRAKYLQQEVGQYGPLDCGMTVLAFRQVTIDEINRRATDLSREKLFATPDNKPYPFDRVYVDDLIAIRDLVRVDDDAHKAEWDERIRTAATEAYERIQKEGLLK